MRRHSTAAESRRKKTLPTATKGKPRAPNPDPDSVKIYANPGDDPAELTARAYLNPRLGSACIIRAYTRREDGSGPAIDALVAELSKQVGVVLEGDLARAEELLTAQAHSLDAIFGVLAQRAAMNAGKYMGACETYLRLALKAQSQCRATLETLATIKNPPSVAFVRQANIASGPQQVNNGILSGEGSRAGKIETTQSKLSGGRNELLSDTGASAIASRIDSKVAAVGEVNRAEDGNG